MVENVMGIKYRIKLQNGLRGMKKVPRNPVILRAKRNNPDNTVVAISIHVGKGNLLDYEQGIPILIRDSMLLPSLSTAKD